MILGLSVLLRHTGILWHMIVGCTNVVLGWSLDCQSVWLCHTGIQGCGVYLCSLGTLLGMMVLQYPTGILCHKVVGYTLGWSLDWMVFLSLGTIPGLMLLICCMGILWHYVIRQSIRYYVMLGISRVTWDTRVDTRHNMALLDMHGSTDLFVAVGFNSCTLPVISGVPLGSVLGPFQY